MSEPAPTFANRRPWVRPAVSLVLLALLLGLAAMLPYHQFLGGYSTAGAWLHAHILPARRNISRPTGLELYFVKEPGRIRVADTDPESADEISRLLDDDSSRRVLRITYRPEIRRLGWWGITHQIDHHAVELNFGGDFTESQRQAAQREFLDRARASLTWVPAPVFARLSRGEIINESRWLPAGLVVNGATLALLVGFILSLRWMREVPRWVRTWRENRALARGRCPTCGYSILNLRTSVCPECGKSFS